MATEINYATVGHLARAGLAPQVLAPPSAQSVDAHDGVTPGFASASFVIVGGGLAGGLIALALVRAGRGRGVVLVEQDKQLGGNHTWSFHQSDLDRQGAELVGELVTHRWPGQMVRFPGHERALDTSYASIRSDHFATVLDKRLRDAGVRILLGSEVSSVAAGQVQLEDGTALAGAVVIDARGPERGLPSPVGGGGFQKFLGLELELASEGPWAVPLLMDATVEQLDGFRFMYVLPFGRRRVLVEDTTYSRSPLLDAADCEARIWEYARLSGARVAGVIRREVGVLPLPGQAPASTSLHSPPSGSSDASAGGAGPLCVGYRGGFFHDVTGYSLPLAVRVALAVANAPTPAAARNDLARLAERLEPQHRFGRLLNRLMFQAMSPHMRWTAFERFYRLPEPVIARFYASQTTWWDRARVLVGRPPAGVAWSRLLSGARTQNRTTTSVGNPKDEGTNHEREN